MINEQMTLMKAQLDQAKITESKLRHDIQLLTSLLESAPDGILIVDGGGKIIQVNVELERLLSWSRDDLLGQSMNMLIPERFRDMHDTHVGNFSKAPRTRQMGTAGELLIMDKFGMELNVDIKLSPVNVDGRILVIAIIRDIRPWKKAEKERQELRSDIEQSKADLRLLSGLLPICSYCKKICDSDNYWHHLESYIHDHSEAKFSHGICPECNVKCLADLGQ